MKQLLTPILFTLLFLPTAQGSHRGRYLKGKRLYALRMSRCAMWWRKLGDIKTSSGKRSTTKTELYKELAKLSRGQFLKWIANPQSMHPRVNCRPGPFHTKREITDLWHFIGRRATHPPKRPILVRRTFKRYRIRLIKTQEILRRRLKTLRQIQKWLPNYRPRTTQKGSRRTRNSR